MQKIWCCRHQHPFHPGYLSYSILLKNESHFKFSPKASPVKRYTLQSLENLPRNVCVQPQRYAYNYLLLSDWVSQWVKLKCYLLIWLYLFVGENPAFSQSFINSLSDMSICGLIDVMMAKMHSYLFSHYFSKCLIKND